MNKYLKLAFISLFVIILQISLFNNFSIAGRNINLLLMYIAFSSQLYGKEIGFTLGLICGLLYDILLSSSVGIKTLGFIFSAYLIGYLREYIFSDRIYVSIFYAVISTLLYKFATGIIYYFLSYNFTLKGVSNYIINFEIILNILIYILIAFISNKNLKKRRLNVG